MLTSANSADVKVADFALSVEFQAPPPYILHDPLFEGSFLLLIVFPFHVLIFLPLDDYCSPESLGVEAVERGYSFPVDLYALGCITYLLLCGFPAFDRARGTFQSYLSILAEIS